MEQKMTTIPFDVELAKEIQAGTKPGKITTRDGRDARIVCWDMKDSLYPIVALTTFAEGHEDCDTYSSNGCWREGVNICDNYDLVLQVPEWTQYKDGDVLACEVDNGGGNFCKWYSVLKSKIVIKHSRPYITSYVDYNYDSSYRVGELIYDDSANNIDSIRLATEEEKQKLIKRLQEEDTTEAKGILKRFFGIEGKQEQKFEFLQPVLVKNNSSKDSWKYGQFTHIVQGKAGTWYHVSGGNYYLNCIPYNDDTKHLLGTTDNWEE